MIGIDDNTLIYYTIIKNDLHVICLNEESDAEIVKLELDSDCYGIVEQDRLLKNDIILKKEDLLNFDFIKHFSNKKFEIIKEEEKSILSFLNNQVLLVHNYEYEEYYNEEKDTTTMDWIYIDTQIYNYYYVEIAKGKKIIVLADGNGYIIPTTKNILINIEDKDFTNSKPTHIDLKELKKGIKYFYAEDYYHIIEEKNNKFSVRDNYNTKVLNKSYDTLFFNSKFIVGKIKDQFEIYNIRLEKLELNNVKAVYEKGSFLQILQNKEVKTINFLNNEEQNIEEPKSVCGTVTGYTLEVKNNTIVYTIHNTFLHSEQGNTEIKGNLSSFNFDTIHFLNNTNKLDFDDNTFYLNPTFETMYKWLIVSKENKYGLVELIISENQITFKEIAPIQYDAIEASGFYNPIKLKKDNLYTYYRVNDKEYKNLEKFNNNFCRFENEEGKKGWLDYKGNEYLD